MVTRTERGWPGHFIAASSCLFRRNTLLEKGDIRVVVSTVGCMLDSLREGKWVEIGLDRYVETMAFHAKWDGHYWDANVTREIYFDSKWAISTIDVTADARANAMHEAVVDELTAKLEVGDTFVNDEGD